MPEFVRIERHRRAPARSQWGAFLELGFRPLYLAGCIWAAVAVALWVHSPQRLIGELGGVLWHAHEMLWGFMGTIAVGFLLTAGGNWTGRNPLKGRMLGVLVALWLLARAGYLWPGHVALYAAAGSETAFFAGAAFALGRSIYGARSQRNYGVPLLLLGLGATNLLYLLAVAGGDGALALQRFNSGLLCMSVIALLVARRVIPFFAMRAIPDLKIPMLASTGTWQLGAGVIAIVATLLPAPHVSGLAMAASGFIALYQLYAWKPQAVGRRPLLWVLYAGYGALGIGLLAASGHAMGWIVRSAWPTHIIAVGGLAVLIIGMVTRTALGHLGRPLQADRFIVLAYVLVMVAACLRLAALVPSTYAAAALHASACAWIAAFGLYVWRFLPMMVRPRADLP